MNKFRKLASWAVICVFIILVFTVLASAQSSTKKSPFVEPIPDTAINPHDFTDEYYASLGINVKGIVGRRTGSDGLSVFGWSSNPNHTNVRVIATLPAYNRYGEMAYWYPLGDLEGSGFTNDEPGVKALETARQFPIYMFPGKGKRGIAPSIFNTRQAAIIDESLRQGSYDPNPLGLRKVFFLFYTDWAFSKECSKIMEYLARKNGLAADDTPIIKTMEEVTYLLDYNMIGMYVPPLFDGPIREQFAIAPVIADPTKGVIAKDAFLWMSIKDGNPLPAEEMFASHFNCLRDKGEWCP